MKKSRFTESQIISILKEGASGVSVADLCRKHGMSNATFYNWRSKYGGMDVSMLKRVKELEAENARLKKMYADSQMDAGSKMRSKMGHPAIEKEAGLRLWK